MTDNLITRLLAEAAARAEKERQQHSKRSDNQGEVSDASTSFNQPRSVLKDVEIAPSPISHDLDDPGQDSVRSSAAKEHIYTVGFLRLLETSPLCDISHLSLPPKDFYRLDVRPFPQGKNRQDYNNGGFGRRNGGRKNGPRRTNNGAGRRDRRNNNNGGYNGGSSNGNHNRRYANEGDDHHYHRGKESDPIVDGAIKMEGEIISKDEEESGGPHSIRDFELWRLKMRIETFKRNGEEVPQDDVEEYQALMSQRSSENTGGSDGGGSGNAVDDEFASIPLNMTPVETERSVDVVARGTDDGTKSLSLIHISEPTRH